MKKRGFYLLLVLSLSDQAQAEQLGFSYRSSDGTVYTSTTAPSYCKRFYDTNAPGRMNVDLGSYMPAACNDPQFTTSRGAHVEEGRRQSSRRQTLEVSDKSSKRGGLLETDEPPTPKEPSAWDKITGFFKGESREEREEFVAPRPPRPIPEPRRKRVLEEEETIVLTPVFKQELKNKKGDLISTDDPLPPKREFDWTGAAKDIKKGGRVTVNEPPKPKRKPVVLPGKDKDKTIVTEDPVPPKGGDEWWKDNGKGKNNNRVEVGEPPAPIGDPWDGVDNQNPKDKKNGRVTVGEPPMPRKQKLPETNEEVDIEALRARLQPIQIIAPSGKVVKPVSQDVACVDTTRPAPLQPFVSWMQELEQFNAKRKLASDAVDPELIAKVRQRTPAQNQCVKDAPKAPSRVILAFEENFNYADHYKKKGVALPEKELDAFKKGNAITSAARKEDRQVPGVHWKYYSHESAEKELLSPAVRCAYEMATRGYKDENGKMVYNTISLVGHSFGGDAAYKVANVLRKLGVRVDLVLTTDARQPIGVQNPVTFTRPANVDRWVNFYQRKDPVLPGFPVDGATNVQIKSGAWHGQIPHDAMVKARAAEEVMKLPRCKGDRKLAAIGQERVCDD